MSKLRLGINIDHVATIRNARGGSHPDPIEIAKLASECKVDNITAHLREDRRHIRDDDIKRLLNEVKIPLNFEMAATDEMVNFAIENLPFACCIVPERRQEITTEGGLNLRRNKNKIKSTIQKLNNSNIRTSLFIDASIKDINIDFESAIYFLNPESNNYMLKDCTADKFSSQLLADSDVITKILSTDDINILYQKDNPEEWNNLFDNGSWRGSE